MATHQQAGRGFRPLAPASAIGSARELYTSVMKRLYFAPIAIGRDLVRRGCNDLPYEVSNTSGATYAKDETVYVIGEAGLRGETIIGRALEQTQDFPTSATISSLSLNIPAPASLCPLSLTGRSYLGVYHDGANSLIYAYRYTDGAYVETLAVYDYTADGISIETDPSWQRVHADGDVILFKGQGLGADLLVCTWDTGPNTLAILECTHPELVNSQCDPLYNGTAHAFFYLEYGAANPRNLQMYKVAIGASGAWNEVTSRIGDPLETDSAAGLAVGNDMIHSGGDTFQVPAVDNTGAGEEAIPYFTAGAWNEGLGRTSHANDLSMGNGYSGYGVAGGRGLRVTFGPLLDPPALIGLMPTAPGSPETSLLPADWTPAAYHSLAVSPAGSEFAVYVDPDGVGPVDQLLRLTVAGPYATLGCPIPSITVEQSPDGFVPEAMLCRD